MDDQQQYLLQDEPLKVLTLFPKREVNSFVLSLDSYAKLYDNLTCTICREVFTNPVYLKCSHRFCKQCIEKYIRSNSKKSCPNCRGGLTTKRDLRLDDNLQSLISFAFGDHKKLTNELEQLDKMMYEKNKYLEMKRTDSQTETKQRPRPQMDQSSSMVSSVIKKMKSNDGEEIKRKKKEITSEKKESKTVIQKQKDNSSDVAQLLKRIAKAQQNYAYFERIEQAQRNIKKLQQKSSGIQTIRPQIIVKQVRVKKKKQVVVIELSSNEQQEYNKEIVSMASNLPLYNNTCSINAIPEISQLESSRKNIIIEEEEEKEKYVVTKMGSQKEIHHQNKKKQQFQQKQIEQPINCIQQSTFIMSDQVKQGRKMLQQQFGCNYLHKVIELIQFPIYILIDLKVHPTHIFTPQLPISTIKVSIRATASLISNMLAEYYNIGAQAIKLYIKDEYNFNGYAEMHENMKLMEANASMWKSNQGIELAELGDVLNGIGEDIGEKMVVKSNQRILYYSIDFDKIN